MENAFPRCRKCGEGDLVPLSDFGSQGASIEYKAWVCTNPTCLYNIKIRNGDNGFKLAGPGLIVHLIGAHTFFEGFESPYRVEPRALAQLLQLGPFASTRS